MKSETRQTTKFLKYPKSINWTVKWLVTATWEEERHPLLNFNWFNILAGYETEWSEWKPTKWL